MKADIEQEREELLRIIEESIDQKLMSILSEIPCNIQQDKIIKTMVTTEGSSNASTK